MALLEHTMRDELNRTATRRLVVLRPIKVVLTNYPEGKAEELDAINNPEDPNAGTRKIPFGRELYIERDDFMETPPPKYFRLRPGGEVRLKYAYIIKCEEVVKDDAGDVTELRCSVDLDSKSGGLTAGRKVKGTIHWVSAAHAIDAEVRLYDRLFTVPGAGCRRRFQIVHKFEFAGSSERKMRTRSLRMRVRKNAINLSASAISRSTQIRRRERQIWNRAATLRDTWAKRRRSRERTRLACCFRRPRRKSLSRIRPAHQCGSRPFDEPSNGARQRRALPIRTSTARGRCAPALFLSRALRAR